MANSSIPASLRLCAGAATSSCDFPSVRKTPILGMPGLDPDSDLKLFSWMKVRARPERKNKEYSQTRRWKLSHELTGAVRRHSPHLSGTCCTCQCVPSFIRQVLYSFHHSLFGGVSVQMPLDSWVAAELSHTWGHTVTVTLLHILLNLSILLWTPVNEDLQTISPILVLSKSTSKALTRLARNILTSLKLARPMLQEPSTSITISAIASVLHTNSASGTKKEMDLHLTLLLNSFTTNQIEHKPEVLLVHVYSCLWC